jgi:hypothetical protein
VVIVLAFMVAAGGFAFGFLGRTTPDQLAALGPIEGIPEAPAVIETPSSAGSSGSSPAAAATGPTGSGACSDQPGSPGEFEPPAEAEPAVAAAVTADCRFANSLASSVGTAPDLAVVGHGTSAFSDEGVLGRTVLSFAGGRGLSLTRTAGFIDSAEYTIELLFRVDDLKGYRKIVDFKKGSDDGGLYSLEGCLDFYPRPPAAAATIEADSYVQVVLTRDASATVAGYVNGVRQFSFRDAGEFAVIDAHDTLRFFRDDSVTEGEYSSGAVYRIRLYDRPLTADEVAGLVCTELRINLAPGRCPGR